ncbi:hypothetical protein K458DRAFT_326926 [Lentithecium fluviatile CBS 122367]|uniref:Transcription factor domain-containing protein n=1 Tax=Lentithecium fluviatile CBS 122367 TaxID=1168545 RepID=A0A6G1JK67_9PLEO|nr:hypothetical protein K458DRAFT_326926 [Lentithecium fluviatile CBS 122367]
MSATTLQFITETTIGPKERRIIRSHVMKGRNAGRSRPPRRSLRHTSRVQPEPKHLAPPEKDWLKANEIQALDYKHTLKLKRMLWNDLSLASFPHHVSPASRHFVYQWLWITAKVLYPPDFCSELDLSRYAWFQYVLEDKAYFHCLLAVSASFTDHFGGNVKAFPEALSHISQAYKLINERLSGPEASSDKAIAVVTVLAIYQRIHHQQSNGLMHFEGLRRMIELRGGLAKLAKENRALAQKPWRLDIEFALQDGSPTSFGLNDLPTASVALPSCKGPQILQLIHTTVDRYHGLSSDVLDHLLDITNFTKLLNNARKDTKLNPLDYAESVFLRLHRLLPFAPLGPWRPIDPLDNLVHLSLLAIMTTLMPEYGHNQARYNLLCIHLQRALHSYAAATVQNKRLLLWALFVGRATILKDSDQRWLAERVGEVCVDLNLLNWVDACESLCEYAWICVLYDKRAMKLWNMARMGKEAGR